MEKVDIKNHYFKTLARSYKAQRVRSGSSNFVGDLWKISYSSIRKRVWFNSWKCSSKSFVELNDGISYFSL